MALSPAQFGAIERLLNKDVDAAFAKHPAEDVTHVLSYEPEVHERGGRMAKIYPHRTRILGEGDIKGSFKIRSGTEHEAADWDALLNAAVKQKKRI